MKYIPEKFLKNKNLIVLLVAGIILMICANLFLPKEKDLKINTTQFQTLDVKQLEKILANISGAGSVSVFVSYDNSGEKVLAYDIKNSTGDKTSQTDQTVKLAGQQPYIIKENTPAIKGILVTATGASDKTVRYRLLESVSAATGISRAKICVEEGIK